MVPGYDLRPLFWLAIFGIVCAAVALVGGSFWLIAFVLEHVRFV